MDILSKPTATLEQCNQWIKGIKTANKLAVQYTPTLYNEAVKRGINPVILIAQAMIETGYFNFTGVLTPNFHNTCGLKTTKGGGDKVANAHMKFKTWEDGIKAHADHLALYAGAKGFPKYSPDCTDENVEYKKNGTTNDPRHFSCLYGCCKTVEGLSGKWATSKSYAESIKKLVKQIESTKVLPNKPSTQKATDNTGKYKNGTYNRRAVITASSLNIRKGRPGSKNYNTILGTYKKNTVVTVHYCLNGWFGVIYKGKQGYICGDYVKLL